MENSDLVKTLVQVVAYITPFFLIPATFKFGLGVFGGLAGMVNDRGRGFFDKQRKGRMEKRAGNWQKAQAGERWNNRGLNALTSQATTKGIPFTRRRREAYQQKINNSSAAFAKSEQAQGVQHNDGALRAMTYGSAAQARANMARDFGMNDAEIASSVSAVQAAGGFGRNRQVWAAQQLSNTGTGYDNLEQVAQTIARTANGNTSQAANLAGNINSSTKAVGRNDLAPGFGALNGLAQAEMGGSATQQQYRTATRQAWNSADINTVVRGKGPEMQQFATHFRETMADPGASPIHKRDAAVALAEMHAALPGASAENQRYINDTMQQVLGPDWANGGPVEEQISVVMGAQGIPMTGAEINQTARKYGNTPAAVATGGITPPPTPPPSGT